jgi:NADP-dependent 3-hydroxy acid dehydrogenase YdfG
MTATVPSVAVITGASRGIGEGLVVAYRKMGYAVVATSRSIAPSDEPMITTVQGEIGVRDTADRVIAEAMNRFGRIDTLVNNAGVFVPKRFTEYTDDDYNHVTTVNLDGFFHITRSAIARMESQGAGHVVTITTTLVEHANASVPSVLASLTKAASQPRRSPWPSSTPRPASGLMPFPQG